MNSKQFLYDLRGKIIEGGVIALTVGGAGYFVRQQYEPGTPGIQLDEIARPPLTYVLYQANSFVLQRLGIKNEAAPYIATIIEIAAWEIAEYTEIFQPVVHFLSLGPNAVGTIIDLGVIGAGTLALIYFNNHLNSTGMRNK